MHQTPNPLKTETRRGDSHFKRGVPPRILLSQVRNTVPFLFEGPEPTDPHLSLLRRVDSQLAATEGDIELGHAGYFRLCLSAHHATVASYVPTDVDNQIRFTLWDPGLPVETTIAMAETVEESAAWDARKMATRWQPSPLDAGYLSGHIGEWLSTAVAAYGALKRKVPDAAQEMLGLIEACVQRHSAIYAEFRKRGDGVSMLMAATTIAHNLGDLDRVIDMWALAETDPLRAKLYKAAHGTAWPQLKHAGDLNKAYMAVHAHRHFPLREPRGLRRSVALLMPINPFLDTWGATVGKSAALQPEDVGEIVEALAHGFTRLVDFGYARALAGIEQSFPGGLNNLGNYLPAKVLRAIKSGPIRTASSVSRQRFEEQMANRALQFNPANHPGK